jgi:hypothetical protein
VCWLEKDGADKVYDLIASFSCIDALVHLWFSRLAFFFVWILRLENC